MSSTGSQSAVLDERLGGEAGAGGFILLAATDDLGAVADTLGPLARHLVTVDRVLDGAGPGEEGAATLVSAEVPGLLIGCVATSPAGAQVIARREGELGLLFGQMPFRTLDLTETAPAARREVLLAWVSGLLAEVAGLLLEDVCQVRLSLATLRREHEDTLENFSELEKAMSYFAMPSRVAKLNLLPSGAVAALDGRDGSPSRVRQLLPVSVYGLAAVEVHLDKAPRGPGVLEVGLRLGSSTVPVRSWSVQAGQLRQGWTSFQLDRALTTREQDASLELTWRDADGRDLPLSLSHANPLSEVCAIVDRGDQLPAPLALRVWGAVPGSSLTSAGLLASLQGRAATPEESASPPIRFALGADEVGRAELLSPRDLVLDWNLISFRPEERDLLVHPVDDQICIAIVRGVSLRDVQALSALVIVDNKEANPVDFALAIVPQQASYFKPQTFLRTWTSVEPTVFTEVKGSVDLKPGAPLDLILATRITGNASATLAWAYFKRIEVVI